MRRVLFDYRVGRRRFLQLTVGTLIYLTGRYRQARAAQYAVGVGEDDNAYVATTRALEASSEWNSTLLAGRIVLIKPNLVAALQANTGATTDPQVVRALVDIALEAGAAQIKIIEGFPGANNFDTCGYDFFADHDPLGRVSLVDLAATKMKLVNVPGGLVYNQMYMPELLYEPNTLLVSVGKMKVHAETLVSLAVKNVFGLSSEAHYRVQAPDASGRFAMHDRGVTQAIIDHNLVRPIDFAVVDAVWAMERTGPWGGRPIRLNTVIAGRNALAVDRVCLAAMSIPQHWVHHLYLAANKGLGPLAMTEVELRGDAVTPRIFELPDIPPLIDLPVATPLMSLQAQNRDLAITYGLNRQCQTQVQIVKTSDLTTEVIPIRLLQDWTLRAMGSYTLSWDGRDEQGADVAPGRYTVRVEATHGEAARNAFASGWVDILDETANPDAMQVGPTSLIFLGNVNGENPPTQSVSITKGNGASFAWNAASSTSWLQLLSNNGTAPSDVAVQASSSGLGDGVYAAQVTVTDVEAQVGGVISVKFILSTPEPQVGSADLVFLGHVGGPSPVQAKVPVTGGNNGAVEWLVSQSPAWLSVSPTSGSGPAELNVAVSLDGVAAGSYEGHIMIIDAQDATLLQSTSILLTVAPAGSVRTLRLPFARRQ